MNINEIKTLTNTFEDLKHIDEFGNEYWNAHELAKAMGYSQYQKFNNAIERAKDAITNNGKNPDEHLTQSDELYFANNGAKREVDGYRMNKYGAYYVAMNADPSKPEVAVAQEYFLQSTVKYEAIKDRLDQKNLIDKRNLLKDANKSLSSTILKHGVNKNEIGTVMNAGDKGFFDMSTKEVKEINNIPQNKPIAERMPAVVAAYKAVAQFNTELEVDTQNANGVTEVSDIAFDENRVMRNMFINKTQGIRPENVLLNKDVKSIESEYNKETKNQLKQLEKIIGE